MVSKKQKSIARSSTEAEYHVVASAAAEILWIKFLILELGIKIPSIPLIYCDNVGATYLCANLVFHSRMKYIAIDFHFVRNKVQEGELCVSEVSSIDHLANALTKPLSSARLQVLRVKIGVRLSSILRGCIEKSSTSTEISR